VGAKSPEESRAVWLRHKWVLAALTIGLVLSLVDISDAIFAAYRGSAGKDTSSGAVVSVTVVPFVNLGSEKDVTYFVDWLTDELINALKKVESLRVDAHIAAAQNKDTGPPTSQLAGTVLRGWARKANDQLRITVELIDLKTGYHLWSDTYDCELRDVFVIQHDIARAVANTLQVKSTGGHNQSFPMRQTDSLEAYNLYLDGLYQMDHKSSKGLMQAIDYFEKAITIDPAFASAYSRLAAAYTALIGWDVIPIHQGLSRARAAAERALEIDSKLPEAHAAMATVNSLSWQWAAANEEFSRAIELDPGNGALREQRAMNYLLPMGRLKEAREEIQQAKMKGPLSPGIGVTLGRMYYCERDYERAIEQCRKTLDLHPKSWDAYFVLGSAFAQQKMFPDAIAAIESIHTSTDNGMVVSLLGYVYGLRDRVNEARAALVQLDEMSKRKYVRRYYRSIIYLGLRNRSDALKYLEKSYEERDPSLIYLAVSPEWDGMREDPRFRALLEKIGLYTPAVGHQNSVHTEMFP
jgi:serine/threonine-protein kinase